MQSDGHGKLSWERALAEDVKKDGKLSTYVALGNGGTTIAGSVSARARRLPLIGLDKYDTALEPLTRRVGNMMHVGYAAKELPVCMFSKRRVFRGDDPSQP